MSAPGVWAGGRRAQEWERREKSDREERVRARTCRSVAVDASAWSDADVDPLWLPCLDTDVPRKNMILMVRLMSLTSQLVGRSEADRALPPLSSS